MRPLKNIHFYSMSRKANILIAGIHVVFRGLKSELDAKMGQISEDFEKGCLAKVSKG